MVYMDCTRVIGQSLVATILLNTSTLGEEKTMILWISEFCCWFIPTCSGINLTKHRYFLCI